jgi:hypothetical protein
MPAAFMVVALAGCSSSGSSVVSTAQAPTTTRPITTHRVAQGAVHRHYPAHHRAALRAGGAACHAPSDVLSGVYHPERLRVLSPCRIAAGTVARVHREPDGDVHIDVALHAGYSTLVNEVNQSAQGGSLLVEFMPRDGGRLPEPSVGDQIRLTGAWVDDTDHGWNELHPVWSVQINGGPVSRSGPQYGGSPAEDRSYDAAQGCRTQSGGICHGYGGSSSTGSNGNATSRAGSSPSRSSGGSSSNSSQSSASFCTTHRCIPSFYEGTGTIVQCADGEWSHSGGRPGVCSGHRGVKE